jgi:hypothetical protein
MKIAKASFLLTSLLASVATISAQQAPPTGLDPSQGTKLAELMCRQLPNVATIIENVVQVEDKSIATPKDSRPPIIIDDVHDALVWLGPRSLPCLVEQLMDTRWMPDPRSEPLLGAPVVGDVAYMILRDKGVPDLLPGLTHKKLNELRMDDWFLWPSVGTHRLLLKGAIRTWLVNHPNCCRDPRLSERPASSELKIRMSAAELGRARMKFSRLHPGMTSTKVLDIAGKPDAVDRSTDNPNEPSPPRSQILGLLGYGSSDRNEKLAFIYFTERWSNDVARRDPLHDRYVILFFSAEGKFTRMFSNVAEIPPVFPKSKAAWERVMWGEPAKKE